MRYLRFVVFLFPLAFAGCVTSDTAPDTGNVDANGNTVSSVPWNKPESWETQGQLGGLQGGQ